VRTISAAEPAKVTLQDGKEREFLLTRGGMTRLKGKLGVSTDQELLHLPAETVMIPLLVESQRSQNGDRLTEDQMADILPVDIMWSGRTVAAIFGASMPDPRPTLAGTTESALAPPKPLPENGPSV
jgi:hypothetical protein